MISWQGLHVSDSYHLRIVQSSKLVFLHLETKLLRQVYNVKQQLGQHMLILHAVIQPSAVRGGAIMFSGSLLEFHQELRSKL